MLPFITSLIIFLLSPVEVNSYKYSYVNEQIPSGALANYDFSAMVSGTTIVNLISGGSALPNLILDTTAPDFAIVNGLIEWNGTHVPPVTQTYPFDATRGSFAKTTADFPNTFTSGTYAIRLKMSSAQATSVGQASAVGFFTFRPSPDTGIETYAPRALHYSREGPTDPIFLRGWEGEPNGCPTGTCIPQDYVQTQPYPMVISTTPASFHTYIVTWNTTTMIMYEDGVDKSARQSGFFPGGITRGLDNMEPGNGAIGDYNTTAYRIMVAVQPSLIHSAEQQFLQGTISHLFIYDRVLNSSEVGNLHNAMTSTSSRMLFLFQFRVRG